MSNIKFVTSVTGSNYIYLLTPHLFSLFQHHPAAEVVVYYKDILGHQLEILQIQFPMVSFITQEITQTEEKVKTIGGRLRFYTEALNSAPAGMRIVFIDCDTLLLKSVEKVFEQDFDVAFTWKEKGFCLNAGVFFVKAGDASKRFLANWNSRTQEILANPRLSQRATRFFGAPDQLSLAELVSRKPLESLNSTAPLDRRASSFDGSFVKDVAGVTMSLLGLKCTQFNQTESAPIRPDTHVIHYKAGWHRILLNKAPYHKHRPKATSKEMHEHWLSIQGQAARHKAISVITSVPIEAAQDVSSCAIDHVERGILNSELLLVYWFIKKFGVRRIIESGRWMGHSTLLLATLLQKSGVKIDSIDLYRSAVSSKCEARLAEYGNVRLYYGNAIRMIPEMLSWSNEPTILLLDGPKGVPAVDLIRDCYNRFPHIVGAFLHDTHIGSRARQAIEATFQAAEFTDLPEYARRFGTLDSGISVGAIHPDQFHGTPEDSRKSLSYGPTLAMILPEQPAGDINPRWRPLMPLKYKTGILEARVREIREFFRVSKSI